MFLVLDILGTLSFVISGALLAINKKLDPFGVFVIAFVTSVGGGTLRDILIGVNLHINKFGDNLVANINSKHLESKQMIIKGKGITWQNTTGDFIVKLNIY